MASSLGGVSRLGGGGGGLFPSPELLDLFEEPPITFITEESKFVALKPLVEDVFGALTTGVVTYGDKE